MGAQRDVRKTHRWRWAVAFFVVTYLVTALLWLPILRSGESLSAALTGPLVFPFLFASVTPSLVASPSGTKRIIVWGSSVIAPEVMVRWLMRSSWAVLGTIGFFAATSHYVTGSPTAFTTGPFGFGGGGEICRSTGTGTVCTSFGPSPWAPALGFGLLGFFLVLLGLLGRRRTTATLAPPPAADPPPA